MNIEDAVPPRGELKICVWRRNEAGRLVLDEMIVEKNLVVNGAKNQLARLIGGDGANRHITQFGVGVGTSPAHPDNVTLTNATWKAVSSVSYPSMGTAQFNWALTTADANGKAITEFALRCADGTLFSRKVRAAINKDADISLTGTWTIFF